VRNLEEMKKLGANIIRAYPNSLVHRNSNAGRKGRENRSWSVVLETKKDQLLKKIMKARSYNNNR
jgi:hypothetical protein